LSTSALPINVFLLRVFSMKVWDLTGFVAMLKSFNSRLINVREMNIIIVSQVMLFLPLGDQLLDATSVF